MKVKVSELRQVATLLFDHLERTGHTEIDVDEDYYWSVPDDRKYLPYQEPKDLTLGQLSHDLDAMKNINSGESKPIAYALVWLSSLLGLVGARIVS